MPAGARMKDAQVEPDRSDEGAAGHGWRKVLYDLDESLKAFYESAQLTESCEAFRSAMRDVRANVRQMNKPRNS